MPSEPPTTGVAIFLLVCVTCKVLSSRSGISSVLADGEAVVTVRDYGVEVESDNPAIVSVYDLAGREIAGTYADGVYRFALQKGVYVVCGKKVMVE